MESPDLVKYLYLWVKKTFAASITNTRADPIGHYFIAFLFVQSLNNFPCERACSIYITSSFLLHWPFAASLFILYRFILILLMKVVLCIEWHNTISLSYSHHTSVTKMERAFSYTCNVFPFWNEKMILKRTVIVIKSGHCLLLDSSPILPFWYWKAEVIYAFYFSI